MSFYDIISPILDESSNYGSSSQVKGEVNRMKKFKLGVNDNNIYDHYYVQNQSFAFDLEILIRTIFF